MPITIESLTKQLPEMQKQYEAAMQAVHQIAGAILLIRNQIEQLKKEEEESKNDKIDNEGTE